jgi:hypothetical protein
LTSNAKFKQPLLKASAESRNTLARCDRQLAHFDS